MRNLINFLASGLILATFSLNANSQPPIFDKEIGTFNPPDYIPIDVATDINGNVYVFDIYHERIRKFDSLGNFLLELNFDVRWVRGIVVDSQGYIYITDAGGVTYGDASGAGILKFDSNGNFIKSWPASSRGLGIDSNDRIYAANEDTDTVQIFDTEGVLLNEIGLGILNNPEDVDAGTDGSIYVADALNARVVKFDAQGNLITTWGTFGSNPDQFKNPASISIDANNNVFVTDRRNYKIKKFTSDGVLLASVGGQGSGPGLFEEPHGLTVDAISGNVWLATYHGQNIQKFDNDLNYLLTIDGYHSAPGEFADVRGVDVDSELNVYVADKWNQRVTKFDRDGNILLTWGRRGQGEGPEFNFPRAVHVDSNDHVYVSDDGHIRKFDKFGNYITRYGKYNYSRGISTDSQNNVYIVEPLRNRIVKINQITGATTFIGTKGSTDGQFSDPWGVAISPDNRMYVTDNGNGRVQRLTLDGVYEMQWGAPQVNGGELKKPTGISIDENGKVYVGDARLDKVLIFDKDGNFLEDFGSTGTGPAQFGKIYAVGIENQDVLYTGDVLNTNVQRFINNIMPDPVLQPQFIPGQDFGYFIGIEHDGYWHVAWSSNGPKNIFQGTIICDQPFIDSYSYRYEPNDTLTVTGNTLEFYGVAKIGDDGLRFKVPTSTACEFDLLINGKKQSAAVAFGENASIPVTLPISITTPDIAIQATGTPVYSKGIDLGTYLWYSKYDNKWKIRFSTDGANRNFTGSITTSGTFSNVSTVAWETKDQYTAAPQLITFDARVASHQDGLNFQMSGANTITLTVSIDGVAQRELIFIGRNNNTPNYLPVPVQP